MPAHFRLPAAIVSACLLWGCAPSQSLLPGVDGATPLSPRAPDGTSPPGTLLPLAGIPSPAELEALAVAPTSSDPLTYRRNYVVGQYLTQSDQLCSEFLQNLTRVQRGYGLAFGSLATVLGGLSTAFTQASVVRPLAAAAAIANAERAQIDAETFARQTSQVIIAAIKNSRARTYNNIVQVNFGRPVGEWPLSVALADVADYHARCSLHEGITEANGSLNATAPTGVASVRAGSGNLTIVGRSEAPPPAAAVAANATIGAAAAAANAGASAAVMAAVVTGGAAAGAPGAAAGAPPATAAVEAAKATAAMSSPAQSQPSRALPQGNRCGGIAVSPTVAMGKTEINARIGRLPPAKVKGAVEALMTVDALKNRGIGEIKGQLDDLTLSATRAKNAVTVIIQGSICSESELRDLTTKVTPSL